MRTQALRIFILSSLLLIISILGKADIHEIYRMHGYKSVPLCYIVQFPFVNSLIENLYLLSHELLKPMLEFVVASQTDLQDLDDLIFLEKELATTSCVHAETLKWLNKWLFAY